MLLPPKENRLGNHASPSLFEGTVPVSISEGRYSAYCGKTDSSVACVFYDALNAKSYITLQQWSGNTDWDNRFYIVAEGALDDRDSNIMAFLNSHPHVTNVIICLDKNFSGDREAKDLGAKLRAMDYSVSRALPSSSSFFCDFEKEWQAARQDSSAQLAEETENPYSSPVFRALTESWVNAKASANKQQDELCEEVSSYYQVSIRDNRYGFDSRYEHGSGETAYRAEYPDMCGYIQYGPWSFSSDDVEKELVARYKLANTVLEPTSEGHVETYYPDDIEWERYQQNTVYRAVCENIGGYDIYGPWRNEKEDAQNELLAYQRGDREIMNAARVESSRLRQESHDTQNIYEEMIASWDEAQTEDFVAEL